jgi:hypothetical protein
MNVETISMPVEQAKAKLEAYKKRLAKMKIGKANAEVAAEYKAAMQGYEALAEGTPLIDLDDVFQNCPCDEQGRPKLAIARADRKQVQLDWDGRNQFITFDSALNYKLSQQSFRIRVSMDRFNLNPIETFSWGTSRRNLTGFALIPMVPADVRPKTGQLKDFFIIWEVERWADKKIGATPDIDPYLLKHLGGSLYAVVAEWDLTELERSIMKGRRAN